MTNLYDYQKIHLKQLTTNLKNRNCIVDCSDTGTGKTFTTIGLCKELNLKPFIICPKSVISNWIDVSNQFNVEIYGIANYELLKNCKYYDKNLNINNKIISKNDGEFIFQKNINDILFVFDEAHKCKNKNTQNTKLLLSVSESQNKIILLSATLCDQIDNLKFFGFILGFYSSVRKYNNFIKQKKEEMKRSIKMNNIPDNFVEFYIFHKMLFPYIGSRMKISELGKLFPKNKIITTSYNLEKFQIIDDLYKDLQKAVDNLHIKEERKNTFEIILRARQKIELLKIPLFIELVEEAIENNFSVVIFLNFLETQKLLSEYLKCDCILHGELSIEQRNKNINDFQTNKSKIIIVMIKIGGTGISLDDTDGKFPRMTLISPTWSGQDFVQILGRTCRANTKSNVIQKIVLCANTIEESVGKVMNEKLINIKGINDGEYKDLDFKQFSLIELIKKK